MDRSQRFGIRNNPALKALLENPVKESFNEGWRELNPGPSVAAPSPVEMDRGGGFAGVGGMTFN